MASTPDFAACSASFAEREVRRGPYMLDVFTLPLDASLTI